MRSGFRWMAAMALLGLCAAAPARAADATEVKGKTMALKVTSTAFAEGQPIPMKYTGQGDDVSPPLTWGEAPKGTQAIALIADDPDAPGKIWIHWVIWNIPATAQGLDEDVAKKEELPTGARQGKNDFSRIGYGGPMPPPGNPHRYFFKVYALTKPLDLRPGATKADLVQAMKGHVLAEGQVMGTYQRK